MNKKFSLIVLLFVALNSFSQFPNTDLWLFKLETDKLNKTTLKKPLNITNREGYDNQPTFSSDGKKIYYVSIKEDNQADIYYYDLRSKKNIPVTKSRVSEYSPTFVEDEKFIASVVVEEDSAQLIHYINTSNGLNEKKLDMDSVGYFNFLNADTVVYYKLTDPHSLRYYSISKEEDKWLCNSPVRGFKTINRHALIYGIKDSSKVTFYVYDFLLHKAYKYADYPSLNEDIIWHPTYGLIKAEENKLLRFDEKQQSWLLLFDFSGFQIKKITRFIFDAKNKYLVVVNNL